MSNDWMAELLAMAEAQKNAPPPQYPIAYYNRGGDGIQATLREHDMTHTRWLPGGVVELVIEEGTEEVVGFNVWGIKHLMREAEEGHQFYVRRDEERAKDERRRLRRAWWRGFFDGLLNPFGPRLLDRQRRTSRRSA